MSITPIRLDNENILSVEFGGFSNNMNSNDNDELRDEDEGGDLRIMALDIRDQVIRDRKGYLIALAMSDSTVKVVKLKVAPNISYIGLSMRLSRVLLSSQGDILVVVSYNASFYLDVMFWSLPPPMDMSSFIEFLH